MMDPSRYGSPTGRSSSRASEPSGFYHGTVKAVANDSTITVQVPRLFGGAHIPDVPVAGGTLTEGDPVVVSFVEGRRGSLLAFAASGSTAVGETSSITSVAAGDNLNGGGTSGGVTLNLDDDISLNSVTASLTGPVQIQVKNSSGSSLSKGSAVYATGSATTTTTSSIYWDLPDTTGWTTHNVTTGTNQLPSGNVLAVFPGTAMDENVRFLAGSGGTTLVIESGSFNITDRSNSKSEHMCLKFDGTETFDAIWITGVVAEGEAMIEFVNASAPITRMVVQDVYCGPLFGGDNTSAPNGPFSHSPNHADYIQSYSPGYIGQLQMAYVQFDGAGGAIPAADGPANTLSGDSKILQGNIGTVSGTDIRHCDFSQGQGPVEEDTHFGGSMAEWLVITGSSPTITDTYILPNETTEANGGQTGWRQALAGSYGATRGLRPGGPLRPKLSDANIYWELPDTSGWNVVNVPTSGGSIYLPAGDNVAVFPEGDVDRNVRFVADSGDVRLSITSGTINITDRTLSESDHHGIKFAGAYNFTEVWVSGMIMKGQALIEGFQCATELTQMTVQNCYIGPIYGGDNTNGPTDGWGHSPSHCDYWQANDDVGGKFADLRVAYVTCDGNGEVAGLDGEGGYSKVFQGAYDSIEVRHCDFWQAQGDPDDDSHHGGSVGAWFYITTPFTMSVHDTYVQPNETSTQSRPTEWAKSQASAYGATRGERPGGALIDSTLTPITTTTTQTSSAASDVLEVGLSDNTTAATMPALGLLNSDLGDGETGYATVLGIVSDVDTSAYSLNDELWVNGSGALQNTRPSSDLVQKLARVVRVDASSGEVLVIGAGRTNDVPNGTLSNDISGNAATASSLETARTINGTSFDGTGDITVTAAAGTLTGGTLNSGVSTSSLNDFLVSGTTRMSLDSEGILVSSSHNIDGGLRLGDVFNGSTSYIGIATENMGTSEYVLLTNGGATFLSAGSGSDLYLRAGANSSTHQIQLDQSAGTTILRTTGGVQIENGWTWYGQDDGLTAVTGNYGSVQTQGSGFGGYEGYSIAGRMVFMENGTGTAGIYDDVNNRWKVRFDVGGATSLYYGTNTTARLSTTNDGVSVTGSAVFDADGIAMTDLGTAFDPAISWNSYRGYGFYAIAGSGVACTVGSASNPTIWVGTASSFHPGSDNTRNLGTSSFRWVDVWAFDNSINSSSDERDKANVTDLDLGLDFINALRPVHYTWDDRSGYVGTREHMGFIAQEVASTLGDQANDRGIWLHDEPKQLYPDSPDNDEMSYDRQGLRYGEFIAPLVKAVQELAARVDALEAQ